MLCWVRQRFGFRSVIAGALVLVGYAAVLAAASAVIVYATPKVLTSIMVQLDAPRASVTPLRPATPRISSLQQPRYAGRLLPTSDWLENLESPKFWKSRGSSGGGLFGLFDDDEDADKPSGTFRTMCVRLCDGYYWPVSFSTTPDRFERDAGVCQSSCAAPARLFVYGNPGQDLADMKDLKSVSYSKLPSASQFKTSYNPSCSCKAQPWQQASKNRHRMYALTRQKRRARSRTARRKIARELRSVKRLVRVQERQFKRQARLAYRGTGGKPSIEPVVVSELMPTKLSPIRRVSSNTPPIQQAPVLRGANMPVVAPAVSRASAKSDRVTAQTKPAVAAKIVQQPALLASRAQTLHPPMALGAQVEPAAPKSRTQRERGVRRSAKRRRGWKRVAFPSDSE